MIALITNNKFIFKRQEIWFYNNLSSSLVSGNNLFIHAYLPPVDKKAINIHKIYTTRIDITQPIEIIKSILSPRLRNYVNKGEKTDFNHFNLVVLDKNVQRMFKIVNLNLNFLRLYIILNLKKYFISK